MDKVAEYKEAIYKQAVDMSGLKNVASKVAPRVGEFVSGAIPGAGYGALTAEKRKKESESNFKKRQIKRALVGGALFGAASSGVFAKQRQFNKAWEDSRNEYKPGGQSWEDYHTEYGRSQESGNGDNFWEDSHKNTGSGESWEDFNKRTYDKYNGGQRSYYSSSSKPDFNKSKRIFEADISKATKKSEVDAAYKNVSKKYHPDLNKNNPTAAEKMKEINAHRDEIRESSWYKKLAYLLELNNVEKLASYKEAIRGK